MQVDASAAFASLEIEEADPEAAAAVEEQSEAEDPGAAHEQKKKKKKKLASPNVGSAFAALGVEDNGDAQAAEPKAAAHAAHLEISTT